MEPADVNPWAYGLRMMMGTGFEAWLFVSQLSWAGLYTLVVFTAIFVFYAILICEGFYYAMGYSFAKANKYVWRWSKRKLDEMDRTFRKQFHRNGLRDVAYYHARDLALLLWFMGALLLLVRPQSTREMLFFAACTAVILVTNSIQGWGGLGERGTFVKFVKVYYRPAMLLLSSLGVGKIIEMLLASNGSTSRLVTELAR